VLATPRVDIDVLADVVADGRIDATLDDTLIALRELPARGGFPTGCRRLGGGFSAWRLALQQGGGATMAALLADIRERSGVALLVIPQEVEGRYAYLAAQQALGPALRTSHILDIGGGSLQVAGAASGWGAALGQKAWKGLLCEALHGRRTPCAIGALDAASLARARELAALQLAPLAASLANSLTTAPPNPPTLTAISRPVTRGIHPALQRLAAARLIDPSLLDAQGFAAPALGAALAVLAPLGSEARQRLTGLSATFVPYLLSDLLLTEAVLRATGASRLDVAESAVSNLPGLLADERAYAWAARHDCYLARLRELGEAAYTADPARCD
jgi:exopolyphosphatase/pppGpp-phosphohydrolase